MDSPFNKSACDESYAQLDLSGKLIIKVQLGDDVRRIPIHNEAITYDELVLMMQRVFRSKLSSSDDITIKYKDEDGDLITIFDSSDLAFAVQYSRILKLQILVGGEEAQKKVVPAQIRSIRRELQKIRDQVNHLLDSLEPTPTEVSSSTIEIRNNSTEQNHAATHLSSREFDPLQDQAQRHAAAERDSTPKEEPPPDGRVNTPDSIGSSGSRRVSSGVDQTGSQQQPAAPPTAAAALQPPAQQQPQQQPVYPQTSQPGQAYQPPEQPQQQPSQQPTPGTQQPYQGGVPGYQRYPVPSPFVGGSVMGQQPQMMVQATGQQTAFRPAYQAYPGVQQQYSAGPQATAAAYRPSTPSQQPQGPQTYPQDYSVGQGAYPFAGLGQSAAGNPYSKGYNRPPSQTSYQ